MSPRVGTSTTDDRKVELTFWARELQDAPALDARTGDGAVRAAAPDEVELLLEAKGAERRDEALRWLACGHRPYVALTRGAVRAYGWVASTDGRRVDRGPPAQNQWGVRLRVTRSWLLPRLLVVTVGHRT